MKEYNVKTYKCEICGYASTNKDDVKSCESKSISQDKGVKIGDTVLITNGDSTGKKAKVTAVFIYNKHWGHYAWKTYWHTVGLQADVIDHWGTRQLTFNDYKVVD